MYLVPKGHKYEVRSISILSDEQSGVVLEVVDGRTEDSVDELCQTALTEEQRNEVRTVCTDMWQPYTRTSYLCPLGTQYKYKGRKHVLPQCFALSRQLSFSGLFKQSSRQVPSP